MAAYKVRRVEIDNHGNMKPVGKRATTIVYPQELKVGGCYFLRKNQLYRVEWIL